MALTVQQRFLHYVSYDTQSDEQSASSPSTAGQRALGEELVRQMKDIGISGARIDESGYVYGWIEATASGRPVIGLIAHMDTAAAVSGKDVRARIVEGYDGGDIPLNQKVALSPKEYPHLKDHIGKRLIVTSGRTLLGADDKAGVAEILSAAERLIASGAPHGRVAIAFTPDEEIGRGADRFDVGGFGADFAYTVDGGELGEIEYENFNAASAKVVVHGLCIHPGGAKGKMKNSILMAMEFHRMLPVFEDPANTEQYEGFHHATSISGDEERTELNYIIRDHDWEKFRRKKARFEKVAAYLNDLWGPGSVELTLTDSYYNMKEKILPHMHIVERAKAAMIKNDIRPVIAPIRGGTDGARLSYMGLPCPNLSTGGYNAHGRFEYIPIESMEKMVDVLIDILIAE